MHTPTTSPGSGGLRSKGRWARSLSRPASAISQCRGPCDTRSTVARSGALSGETSWIAVAQAARVAEPGAVVVVTPLGASPMSTWPAASIRAGMTFS